jgi:hypothetical protein
MSISWIHSPNLKICALRCFGAILRVICSAGFIYTVRLRFGMSGMWNWWSCFEAGRHGCRSCRWRRPSQLWRRRRPGGGLQSRDSPLLGFHALARQGGRESRGPFYFFQVPYWMEHRQKPNIVFNVMLPPLKEAPLSFNSNTQALWCHPSLWSLR